MNFPRIYNKTDFGLTADVVCQPAMYSPIGTVTVPAQQMLSYGIGGTAGGVDTREVCFIDVKSNDATPANLEGKVRLVIADANLINRVVIAEQRTERLRASQNDLTTGFRLGNAPAWAKQDSKLIIEFYPDNAAAVTVGYDTGETDMLVPVVVRQ